MITEIDIHLPLRKAAKEQARRKAVAQQLGISPHRVLAMRLLKDSIDARRRPICRQLRLLVGVDEQLPPAELPRRDYAPVPSGARTVIIVGSGPGGLFAALRCLELGLRPVVLERGRDVFARSLDLQPLHAGAYVTEESNYCFGEGGAGTFSDGKLFTRATKRGPVMEVYGTFVAHGASPDILTDAQPHLGSDKLPDIIKAMRHSIIAAGGEVHFSTRVDGLLRSADGKRLRGVRSADGREWVGHAVILATGHSARDVYRMLHAEGLTLEQKTFAVGVRIEHPQALIDTAQYHLRPGEARPEELPAARYTLATNIDDRGVHSFCMCPGGHIVPAATANDEVVVNGMSLSARDSYWANSGFVVTVKPEDTAACAAEHGVLAGLAWQKQLEIATAQAGGGQLRAPAQRAVDFLAGRVSATLPQSSYEPGLTSHDLHALLPDFVSRRMREGLQFFNRKLRGFAGEDALLIGCETRTSSPLRIPRDPATLQHVDLPGLFPCGEGAGYAGGIVSAALDGRRCAEAVAQC
ncbi:MAG: FAD-binding protein [Akkermansia sp.]|nr:FAD-binding protein [Akkermansia sp.]